MAFASTLMGQKVSFLLRLGPKYRVRPLLSLCHFAGPGVSGDPEGKGDRQRFPQGQDTELESINGHYKSPVVLLKKGKQDTYWKRAWEPLRA